ncbi:MAG: ABC transporter substrate-binding protein [Firmicutes bacterium]|nr:ABC transporter substrate-binding protein [Bacillota bacterium]
MKKLWMALLLGLALCLTAACAANDQTPGGDAAEETDTQTAENEPETIRVGMAGKDIKTACIILAQSLGLFEEEGVNVEFETISNLAEGLTAVDMGKLDLLPFGVIPTATFVSQGTDVVIIGGTISEGSEAITLPENIDNFKTPDDFRGKKVGCYRMETGHMVMKGLLREAGLTIGEGQDVEFVLMDGMPSICEAVKKGELDIGFVNSGYGEIAKQNDLAVAFYVSEWKSGFPCCRQTVSRAALTDKRDALVRFMTACLRAYEIYLSDHETTVDALAEYSGQSKDYVEAVMYHGAMVISLDPNRNKVDDFYQVMKANGDIDANTPYELRDYTDVTVYEDALNGLLEQNPDDEVLLQLKEEFQTNNF